MSGAIKRVTATGDVTTEDARLFAVVLTAGSDAATLVVREGGSGGTIVLDVKAAASTTASVDLFGALCSGGVHATLTGTGPTATFAHG